MENNNFKFLKTGHSAAVFMTFLKIIIAQLIEIFYFARYHNLSFKNKFFHYFVLLGGFSAVLDVGATTCEDNATLGKRIIFLKSLYQCQEECTAPDATKLEHNVTSGIDSYVIKVTKLAQQEDEFCDVTRFDANETMYPKAMKHFNEMFTDETNKYNFTEVLIKEKCLIQTKSDKVEWEEFAKPFNQQDLQTMDKTPVSSEKFCSSFQRNIEVSLEENLMQNSSPELYKTISYKNHSKNFVTPSSTTYFNYLYNNNQRKDYNPNSHHMKNNLIRNLDYQSNLDYLNNIRNLTFNLSVDGLELRMLRNEEYNNERGKNIISDELKKLKNYFYPDKTTNNYHDYCIIGAGPAGLQMAHFLKQAGRDYIIYEKSNISGSFFEVFPRHRRLISINKRFTGKTNEEFQLRHDWNSLLSNDKSLRFKYFSNDYFPHADSMISYLNEYKRKLDLRVQYNSEIRNIRRILKSNGTPLFLMNDAKDNLLTCRYMIMATGMEKPNNPFFAGSDMAEGYEDMDLNLQKFKGKTVLILGRGNSAFETAASIYEHTNMVHMVSRSRARLAWSTHYVGDLRAINNGLLDSYQLKSLDGLLEAPVEEMMLQKKKNKIFVRFAAEDSRIPPRNDTRATSSKDNFSTGERNKDIDNFSLREGYDFVIRCLGFKFDFSPFHSSTRISPARNLMKFPAIKSTYESKTIPDLYFAGTNTHSLDYRKSSGGFIHGFRYAVRTLHRLLEWKNHGKKWPLKSYTSNDLLNILLKRMNEGSGPYQMFGMLGDIFIFKGNGRSFDIIEEFPVSLLHRIESLTGHEMTGEKNSVLILLMDYGPDFSGPDKDTFRPDRATGDPLDAHRSNFLHPVLFYYDHMPTEEEMLVKWNKLSLPKPSRLHHVLEDFLTSWITRQSHIVPLRRFLENILEKDFRHQFGKKCLQFSLTSSNLPFKCYNSIIL